MKHEPQRTCLGCNCKKEQKELIRIVKNKENEIKIDNKGKSEGRGAYICNNIECLQSIEKSKRLEKAFKQKIEKDIYENIRGVILEK